VQFHGCYCILNVDLTGSFCSDFEFSFAMLQSQLFLVITHIIVPLNFHLSPLIRPRVNSTVISISINVYFYDVVDIDYFRWTRADF